MKFEVILTKTYQRKAIKFFRKHQEILNQYEKTLKTLSINPYHPALRLHKLKERLKSSYSISINRQYRITIEFLLEDRKIIPLDIGSHNQVYNH
jgi:proteic killer suppression protein